MSDTAIFWKRWTNWKRFTKKYEFECSNIDVDFDIEDNVNNSMHKIELKEIDQEKEGL